MELYYDDIVVKSDNHKKTILNKGSIYVPNTGVCIITGKNGFGKTLLIKNIFFNLKKNGVNGISFVNQKNGMIINGASVYENISMGISNDDYVKEWLIENNVYVTNKINCSKLSGGESRFIAILRALFSLSNVVIMDEPTNDLDYRKVNALLEIINKQKNSKLFIIVTHDTRFFDIHDVHYEINNFELINKLCAENATETESHYEEIKNTNISFIKSKFKRNYIVIFILILFLFFYCFLLKSMNTLEKNDENYLTEKQIDIFLPTSDGASPYIFQGAVPISYLEFLVEDMSFFDKIKALANWSNDDRDAITYGLEMEGTKDFDVYTIEMYNTVNKECILLLDEYMDDKYQLDSVKYRFYTDDLFVYDKDTREVINFDSNDFLNYLDNIKSNDDIKIRHQIVCLNQNFSFYDFMKTEEFKELSKGNYYVRSKETMEVFDMVNAFNKIIHMMLFVIILFIFIIVLSIFLEYIYVKTESRKIEIFRDYGFSFEEVYKIILKNNIDYKLFIYMILIIFVLHGILFIFGTSSNYRMNFSVLLIVIFISSFVVQLNKLFLRIRVSKIFSWRFR